MALNIIQKVFAQGVGSNPSPTSLPSGGGFQINPPTGLPTNVCVLLDNIANFLFTIIAPLAGLMILWAAFQILTAAGDPAKFTTGKRTMVYALVGLGIVIISKGIVAIITGLLGVDAGSFLCQK